MDTRVVSCLSARGESPKHDWGTLIDLPKLARSYADLPSTYLEAGEHVVDFSEGVVMPRELHHSIQL